MDVWREQSGQVSFLNIFHPNSPRIHFAKHKIGSGFVPPNFPHQALEEAVYIVTITSYLEVEMVFRENCVCCLQVLERRVR